MAIDWSNNLLNSIPAAAESSNQALESLGKMGQYLNEFSFKQNEAKKDREYQQAQLDLQRDKLQQDRADKDRDFLLDYQKQVTAEKATNIDALYKAEDQMFQRQQATREQAKFDKEITRESLMQDPEVLKELADFGVNGGDPSKLSRKASMALSPKDYISLLKTANSKSLSNQQKVAKQAVYNVGEPLIMKYATQLKVLDPQTGKTNLSEISSALNKDLNDLFNNGSYDAESIMDLLKNSQTYIKNQAVLLNGGKSVSSSSGGSGTTTAYKWEQKKNPKTGKTEWVKSDTPLSADEWEQAQINGERVTVTKKDKNGNVISSTQQNKPNNKPKSALEKLLEEDGGV